MLRLRLSSPREVRMGARIAIVAMMLGFASQAGAQQAGRIVGRVTDAATGAPLAEVQVYIGGTGMGTLTRATGQFLILNVPPGTHELRAERIGLATLVRQVQVADGQVVDVEFALSSQALG